MADPKRTPDHLRHGSVRVVCVVCAREYRTQPSRAARTREICCSMPCRVENIRRHAIDRQFWAKVEKTETCWIWTGGVNKPGVRGGEHGIVCIHNRHVFAHRFSYELHNGPIPEGLFVLHHCDVPRCVNPAHLYVGTQQDNMNDAKRRNRIVVPRHLSLTERTHCVNGHATAEWVVAGSYGYYCRRCKQIQNLKRRELFRQNSKFGRVMNPIQEG